MQERHPTHIEINFAGCITPSPMQPPCSGAAIVMTVQRGGQSVHASWEPGMQLFLYWMNHQWWIRCEEPDSSFPAMRQTWPRARALSPQPNATLAQHGQACRVCCATLPSQAQHFPAFPPHISSASVGFEQPTHSCFPCPI